MPSTNWRRVFSLLATGPSVSGLLKLNRSSTVACWDGSVDASGNLLDTSGLGRNLAPTNAPTRAVSTLQGQDGNKWLGRTFNGTTQYYFKAHNAWMNIFSSNFTITVVLKSVSTGSGNDTLLNHASGSSSGVYMNVADTTGYADCRFYPTLATATGPAVSLRDDKYHTIQVVRRSNIATVCVDGVSGTPIGVTGKGIDGDATFQMGTGVSPFEGDILYTRLDNAALTDAQLEYDRNVLIGTGLGTTWGASMDFARAGTAYQTFSDGTMSLRPSGMPRVGEGVLIEGAGTNLLSYSEDLTNAIYTKIQDGFGHPCTISANGKSSSSGLATMDGIIAPAFGALLGNAPYGVKANATLTAAAYTLSAEVQKGNKNFLYMSMNTDLSWTEVATGAVSKPSARFGHTMAYDASRGKVVLFGGYDGAYKQDTWEWDGTAGTWADVTPVGTKPSARYYIALAYDASRGKVVLFGGLDGVSKQDTWEWDGTAGTWTDVTPVGTKPSARYYHALAYDASRGKVVLFGGLDGVSKQDAWEFSTAAYAYFDNNNGIVMDVGASATAKIEAKSGGNYRCSVSSTGTARSYPVVIMPATASGTIYTVGDAATVNGWIGNVQLELGSFPTSYTPNATTSTVNGRLADDLSVPTYRLRNTLKDILTVQPTMALDFGQDPSGATITSDTGSYVCTKTGQPKKYSSPIYGDYHLFDGATDMYTTTVANPAGNFSLHGTFTPSTVSGVHVIASKWNTTSDKRGWTFYQDNATLVLSRSTDGAVGTVLSATLSACLVAGKPTDFTASYDTVNGLVVRADALTAATQAATGAVYASNALFTIGNDAFGSGFLGGKLHNVYYYDHGVGGTVLSAANHAALYAAWKQAGVLPTSVGSADHYKKIRIVGEYRGRAASQSGVIIDIGGAIGASDADTNRIKVAMATTTLRCGVYGNGESTERFSTYTVAHDRWNSFDLVLNLADLTASTLTVNGLAGTLDVTTMTGAKTLNLLDTWITVGNDYAKANPANADIRGVVGYIASD